jgi:hypothetical protein
MLSRMPRRSAHGVPRLLKPVHPVSAGPFGLVSTDGDDQPLLCLRHAAALTTYAPSGDMRTMPLPHDVCGDAWPIALVQRCRLTPG